ncbi:MAG: DUF4116 domain-containing protein [Tenuifilaceae bacterium]|jgi:hypothetical protein|nr:DUF4116 domain-containing protein [Tenuifilaceae bacterium]
MIDFNLIRKKPEPIEIRAYLYQIISSRFGLSDVIIEKMKEKFPSLSDNHNDWDLNQLEIPDIENLLNDKTTDEECEDMEDISGIENIHFQPRFIPDEIFFFKKDYEQINYASNDYKSIPIIFTSVIQVSFDYGGLIEMECFESQISILFDSNGYQLEEYCHDIDLGTDGLVLLRFSKNDGGIWHLYRYNGQYLDDCDGEIFGPFDSPSDFPSIRNRDLIPEMFSLGEFPIPENYPPQNLTRNDVIKELAKNEYYYRYLAEHYSDDEELAIYAVDSNVLAFTLLSHRLQSNKEFVIELINRKSRNKSLYDYLNDSFKKDMEIIKLCVSGKPRIIKNIGKPVTDKELLLLAIQKDGGVLKYAEPKLLNDKDFIHSVVRVNGEAIRLASEELKNDKSLAIEAVKENGFALQYVSDELKNDKDVVIEAVKNRKYAIDYASPNLQNDREFLEYLEQLGFEYSDNRDLPF